MEPFQRLPQSKARSLGRLRRGETPRRFLWSFLLRLFSRKKATNDLQIRDIRGCTPPHLVGGGALDAPPRSIKGDRTISTSDFGGGEGPSQTPKFLLLLRASTSSPWLGEVSEMQQPRMWGVGELAASPPRGRGDRVRSTKRKSCEAGFPGWRSQSQNFGV